MKTYKIYGAPGTGKTTFLLQKLEEEIANGTPVKRIAFVTHTVAAKNEARQRAKSKLPFIQDTDFQYFRTIHGICYSQIGLNAPNVMQTSDYLDFGNKACLEFSTQFTGEVDETGMPYGWMHSPGNDILAIYQYAAAHMLDPFHPKIMYDWPPNVTPEEVKYVLGAYRTWKTDNSKFDFVDMLNMYLGDVNQPLDVDVLFIDEGQDLSTLQWAVVHKFMRKCKRTYIAGDDDQAIYVFIGADPNGFYKHVSDEDIILPQTYRFGRTIWDYALSIISNVRDRQAKEIRVKDAPGKVTFWNADPDYLELDGNVMIIARHHKQLAGIARMLERRGTPFTHGGKALTGSPRAEAVHALLVARTGKPIPVKSAARLARLIGLKDAAKSLSMEARLHSDLFISKEQLAKLGVRYDVPWIEYLAKTKFDQAQNDLLDMIVSQRGVGALLEIPQIDLTTYHGAKGRQAKTVVLFTNCFRSAWDSAERDPDDERRLSYVGATRAMEELIVVAPTSNMYMRSLA